MEGGEWWKTIKWQTKATSTLKTAKWHPVVPFSGPDIAQSN